MDLLSWTMYFKYILFDGAEAGISYLISDWETVKMTENELEGLLRECRKR